MNERGGMEHLEGASGGNDPARIKAEGGRGAHDEDTAQPLAADEAVLHGIREAPGARVWLRDAICQDGVKDGGVARQGFTRDGASGHGRFGTQLRSSLTPAAAGGA